MVAEIEAKFLNIEPSVIREKLITLGFSCIHARRIMTRVTMHMAGDRRNIHEWWRVRDEGDGIITMTWKCRVENTIDGTQECEIRVSDFDDAVSILQKTGLELVARQETAREKWHHNNVEVTIDEWPGLNPFIEVEGQTKEDVERVAAGLGFDIANAVFGGVGNVYQMELGYTPEAVNGWPVISFTNPPLPLTTICKQK